MFEVLSHKNWGASSTLMNNIARDTYDYDKYPTVSKLMWEGMDGRPAAWRVVFKALTLLEHLVKNGSEVRGGERRAKRRRGERWVGWGERNKREESEEESEEEKRRRGERKRERKRRAMGWLGGAKQASRGR